MKLIDYEVIGIDGMSPVKLSLDVRVDLVDGRLPTKVELGEVLKYLLKKNKLFKKIFVTFYLPGMKTGTGAFAAADGSLINIFVSLIPDQYKGLGAKC